MCSVGVGANTVQAQKPVVIDIFPERVLHQQLPAQLFGFNIHQWHFQDELADQHGQVKPSVARHLRRLQGGIYRYPGGLLGNVFSWPEAVGPISQRKAQKLVKWSEPKIAKFGLEQYFDLVTQVRGQPWIVLNLMGWHTEKIVHELPSHKVAETNAWLAQNIRANLNQRGVSAAQHVYYELGNELDRADFEWSHDKYITRSRDTIDAILRVDPQAKFVAFLRDFDWRYRRGARKGQYSRMQKFVQDVLTGLPEVTDMSLHYYYDDAGLEHKNPKRIPWRLRQFDDAIAVATTVRGAPINVWVTEHARGVNLTKPKPMQRAAQTSNTDAAISVADFLTALAGMPAVKGAALHGLNAGPWQVFDATIKHRDLRPRPTFDAMTTLHSMPLHTVVAHRLKDPLPGEYAERYNVRARVFSNVSRDQFGLWLVNRQQGLREVHLRLPQQQACDISLSGKILQAITGIGDSMNSIDVDQKLSSSRIDPNHVQVEFALPGRSVASLVFSCAAPRP